MKKKFQYYRPKRILSHTGKKMITKRKPIDRLDHGEGIHSKKGILSHSYDSKREGRDVASKAPTIGLQD